MQYLLIALFFSFISGRLFKRATGTISLYSPNMMSLIYYFYFLLNNVVGAILVVNSVDDHYIINKISNDTYRYYGFWTIMYTIVGFPLGQLLANHIFHKSNMSVLYQSYLSKSICDEHLSIRVHTKRIFILLSVLSMLSVIYTLVTIGGSPLFALTGGADTHDLLVLRADANHGFGGNEYIRNIFGTLLTPLLTYISYGYYNYKRNRLNKIWFWSMFVSSIFMLTYDLEKAPLILFLLGFLFYHVYMGYRLSKKVLLGTFGIASTMIITMYVILESYDVNTIFVYNLGIVGRLILTSNAGVFMSYDLFPNNHSFLGFSSFSQILCEVFGMQHSERAARLVMEFVNPDGVNSGLAGVFNSLFVSEAWANWGLIGVMLSPLYVGFIIQCLYLYILSHRKTPFYMGLFVFYTINCSINGGINDYIYNFSFIVLIVIYYLAYGRFR